MRKLILKQRTIESLNMIAGIIGVLVFMALAYNAADYEKRMTIESAFWASAGCALLGTMYVYGAILLFRDWRARKAARRQHTTE